MKTEDMARLCEEWTTLQTRMITDAEFLAIARRLRLLAEVAKRADTFIRADGRNDPPARYAELKKSVQALDADEREGGTP
jgi:hypothetical protein